MVRKSEKRLEEYRGDVRPGQAGRTLQVQVVQSFDYSKSNKKFVMN